MTLQRAHVQPSLDLTRVSWMSGGTEVTDRATFSDESSQISDAVEESPRGSGGLLSRGLSATPRHDMCHAPPSPARLVT